MDAANFDSHEISNAISTFLCPPRIKKLFRITEFFLVFIFLLSASTRLPFAFKISGEYLRQLFNVVVSPLFIFLLSNVIVLTLFFKSRNSHIETHNLDFCQEFIANGDHFTPLTTRESSLQAEEIVFQDKQTIFEVAKVEAHGGGQPENLRRKDNCSSCGKRLRRPETEELRQVAGGGNAAAEDVEIVEELSNEEFQRTIEAFIAKQIKFHQQEKLAIVLHGCM